MISCTIEIGDASGVALAVRRCSRNAEIEASFKCDFCIHRKFVCCSMLIVALLLSFSLEQLVSVRNHFAFQCLDATINSSSDTHSLQRKYNCSSNSTHTYALHKVNEIQKHLTFTHPTQMDMNERATQHHRAILHGKCARTWKLEQRTTNYAMKLFWNNGTNDVTRHPSNLLHANDLSCTQRRSALQMEAAAVAILGNQSKRRDLQRAKIYHTFRCAKITSGCCSIVSHISLSANSRHFILYSARLIRAIHLHRILQCRLWHVWRVCDVMLASIVFVSTSDDVVTKWQ